MVRDELKKAGATALAVTGLDCVGWLTNMRARDLPCTPLAVAYALVTMDSCTLFIAPGRLNDADAKTLADNGVSLRDYPELIDAVHALPAEEVFLVDEKATNYDLYCALNEHKTVTGADPIFALKGVKNPVELANIRECHVRDGVAWCVSRWTWKRPSPRAKSCTRLTLKRCCKNACRNARLF